METAIERKYALTRVEAGDYILPSNDGKAIWRIMRYEDGPSHGLIAEGIERDFLTWGCWKWMGRTDRIDLDEFGDAGWMFWEGNCSSRAEAIERALRVSRV